MHIIMVQLFTDGSLCLFSSFCTSSCGALGESVCALGFSLHKSNNLHKCFEKSVKSVTVVYDIF